LNEQASKYLPVRSGDYVHPSSPREHLFWRQEKKKDKRINATSTSVRVANMDHLPCLEEPVVAMGATVRVEGGVVRSIVQALEFLA
jgi:hypothetical protein